MPLIFFAQEDRFQIRVATEAAAGFPAGSFSESVSVPAYALRVEGDGAGAASFFLLPAGTAQFHWVPMEHRRLARRS